MLKLNDEGKWVMPRGISVHDMACEIKDAVRDQDDEIDAVNWYEGHLGQDFTAVKQHVKVTPNGNADTTTLPKVR